MYRDFLFNTYMKIVLRKGQIKLYINGEFLIDLTSTYFPDISKLEDISNIEEAVEYIFRANDYLEKRKRELNRDEYEEEYMELLGVYPESSENIDTLFERICFQMVDWANSKYDNKYLHFSLGKLIIKKLKDIGDPIAIKKYYKELYKGLNSKNYNLVLEILEDTSDIIDYLENNCDVKILVNILKANTTFINHYIFGKIYEWAKNKLRKALVELLCNTEDSLAEYINYFLYFVARPIKDTSQYGYLYGNKNRENQSYHFKKLDKNEIEYVISNEDFVAKMKKILSRKRIKGNSVIFFRDDVIQAIKPFMNYIRELADEKVFFKFVNKLFINPNKEIYKSLMD